MKMLILFFGLLTTLASADNSNSKACLWQENQGLPYGGSKIKTIQDTTDTFDKCVEECEADANCHGFSWFKTQGYGCTLTTHNGFFAENNDADYYNLIAKRDCRPLVECEAEYVGCYFGAEAHMKFGPKKGSYDLKSCNDECQGYTYFGIEEHDDCYCGETLYTGGKRPDSECEEFGDPWNGGTNKVEIYKTCAQTETATTKSFEYGTMDVMGVTYLAAVQTDGDIEVKGHMSHGVYLDQQIPTGKYKAVTGGTYHACGLKSTDNKVDCWGGEGWAAGNEPKDVAFRHIDSGCNGACGIRMDNSQLECWADVFCSDATCKWISDMRTDVKGVAVDYVSCGCYSCCAVLSSDSTIKCWHDPNNYWATKIDHPYPDQAYKLVEVGLHIIGIKPDGLVDVWGNFNGPPPADIKFKKVKNLWGMVCGIQESNSAIYCWDYTDVNYPNILRGEVLSGVAYKDLAVGHHFVCGVRVDDSKIDCEGVWHYTAHFQTFHDTYLAPYKYTAAGATESVSYTYEKTQTAEIDGRTVSMGLLTDNVFCNWYKRDDGTYVTYIDISTGDTREKCAEDILDDVKCDPHWMAYEQGPRHACRCYTLDGGPWSWDADNEHVDPFDPAHCYKWPENEIWYLTTSAAAELEVGLAENLESQPTSYIGAVYIVMFVLLGGFIAKNLWTACTNTQEKRNLLSTSYSKVSAEMDAI